MNWSDVLSGAAIGALIAAIVNVLGLVVMSRTAAANRRSTEIIARERLDLDRWVAAQDRLFDKRAVAYVEGRAILAYLATIASGTSTPRRGGFESNWQDKASEDMRSDLLNRLHVYGSPAAADLFAQAWTDLYESVLRRANGQDDVVRRRADESMARGQRLLEEFTRICQEDLAGGPRMLRLAEQASGRP
jgi:hypothetical protein